MMDLKTYDREQMRNLEAAAHRREEFKLLGAGLETWYQVKSYGTGADDRGHFVQVTLEQATEASGPAAPVWNGPEDGLPPVGLEVEVLWSSLKAEYVTGKILAHDEGRAVFRFTSGERKGDYQSDGVFFSTRVDRLPTFRPIRTAEQLAAEERERQVNKMADIAAPLINRYAIAERLYDAGARIPGEGSKP